MSPAGPARKDAHRLLDALHDVLAHEPLDLTEAALVIARLEYPNLDPQPYRDTLNRLGAEAARRLGRVSGPSPRARVAVLNALLFEEERFAGNLARYEDVRNSFINEVIDRRVGIPITLALIYIEVARRAGWHVDGVSFPGHFLLRVPGVGDDDLILDPFAAGAEVTEEDGRLLFARHMGQEQADAPVDPVLFEPCTSRHLIARMLNNLKRAYLELRLFPLARMVTDLLLAVEPTRLSELRDRGLIAYHLEDFPSALRDLEDYLRLNGWSEHSENADREECDEIFEHIKTLKRRVAGMN
jgi:regulator of sirC expression with transglutaminase-like and TPR domain